MLSWEELRASRPGFGIAKAARCVGAVPGAGARSAVQAVQVRAQGVGGEVLLPAPRGEQVDLAGGVAIDALQNIDQIVVGVDVVQAAGDDQTLQGGHRLGADLAPAEQPVFAI